ncbi:hypothetical protein K2224_34140 (plasmid) [Streptomyces sp. BHT-5-2]|uniref:hypothetical protein n=1 Tax=Streptomyces sp. BHT-5-2 TaxID=2866715 RepID=UPI001C8D6DE7|nr:hypothetical protein [Streptomyces sp. BHT-5-2]QZL04206.1 hypothetical protein K2224_14180 [Streptomyces sp. BHT-5-2]QZL08176.1 hypothetical protein K2224_34140 [Streptomyces sp. BHT-5-2]
MSRPQSTTLDGGLGRWRVLSCYTANLAAYLEECRPADDVADTLARSVRLAVRTDLADGIGFSHHSTPLNQTREGRTLVYRGSDRPDEVAEALRQEYASRGCLLILTHSSHLPWSLSGPEHDAPHFLLVDSYDPHQGRWHAVDHFAGLMASGQEQKAFEGWVTTTVLLDAMCGPADFTPDQELRNQLVFGFPVALPPTRYRWLTWTDAPEGDGEPQGRWLYEPQEVWSFLAGRLNEDMTAGFRPGFLDDLWGASQHHRFRYTRLLATEGVARPDLCALVDEADGAWAHLPQTLRFAADSALRGRPRTALVTTTLEHLAEKEHALRRAAPHFGPPSWASQPPLSRSQP